MTDFADTTLFAIVLVGPHAAFIWLLVADG
jgi:hypothetical protein